MNAPGTERIAWSLRRWLAIAALVFFAHLAILWFLGERPQPRPAPAVFRTSIRLATGERSAPQLAHSPGLTDPTALALPSLRGFSGAAWLAFEPPQHQLTDWMEPPQWLALVPERLGEGFAGLLNTGAATPLRIADKPMPELIGAEPQLTSELQPAPSLLLVEGALQHRAPGTPLALPAWPHTDVLSNTVVQVLVDERGDVITATLMAGCGLKAADQHALKLAAETRFTPLAAQRRDGRTAEPGWGKLVFQWQTVPPPPVSATTNATAGVR